MLESVDKDVIRKGAKGKVGWVHRLGLTVNRQAWGFGCTVQ